jgi:hypothetical protein
MKLKLHWAERFETIREYPSFELNSDEHPELEMEMLAVHSAGSLDHRRQALQQLEYSMNHTTTERGETIMQMFGPWEEKDKSQAYRSLEDEGFLMLSEEKS